MIIISRARLWDFALGACRSILLLGLPPYYIITRSNYSKFTSNIYACNNACKP